MIKIKYLNIFWLIVPILFLQPSFACGCGEDYDRGVSVIAILLLILIFFMPLIYALIKFRFSQLLVFVFPYILSLVIIGGVYLLQENYAVKILLPMINQPIYIEHITIVGSALVVLIWIITAIYINRKSKLAK